MPLQYQLAYTYKGFALYLLIVLLGIIICLATKKKNIPAAFWKCLLCISYALMLSSVLLGYADYYDYCMQVYFLFMTVSTIGYIGCFINKVTFCRTNAIQMGVVSTVVLIWYLSAMLSTITIKEYPSIIFSGATSIIITEAFWLFCIQRTGLHYSLKNRKWIILLLFFVSILSINALTSVSMWDELYFVQGIRSAARWEFTPGTISKLNLVAHKSAGYTFFAEIGVWLFKDEVFGVHFIQLIMMLMSVFAFWRIIEKKFSDMSSIEQILAVSMYAFSPALFGMVPYINVDYPELIFLTWLLCCYYSEWYILELVCAVLLCFSKETALFIYAGFVIGVYIERFICNHEKKLLKRVFCSFKLSEYFRYSFPAVLWLLFFIIAEKNYEKLGVWGSAAGEYLKWQGKIVDLNRFLNCMGWSNLYVINQLKQLFLMNFMWIISIGILLLLLAKCILKKNHQGTPKGLIPLFSSVIGFTIITILFVTHNHYRYKIAIDIVLLLMFIILVQAVILKTVIRKVLYGTISVLFLIQSFWSLDPVTNSMGRLISLGNQRVMNYDIGFGNGVFVSDYIVYNRQASEWGKTVEKMLYSVEADEETLILLPKLSSETVYQVFGGFSQQSMERAGIYVDNMKKDFRTFASDKGYTRIQYGEIQEDGRIVGRDADYSMVNLDMKEYDKVIYIKLPFVEEDINKNALKNLDKLVREEINIENNLCSIDVLIF